MDVLGHAVDVQSGRNREVQRDVAGLRDDWRLHGLVVREVEEEVRIPVLLQAW
jgi:hypothetical protein